MQVQTAENRDISITNNDGKDRRELERQVQPVPVNLQPNQPSDLPGPKGKRVFKPSWFKTWNWLEWIEGKAFCHTCRVAMDMKLITLIPSLLKGFQTGSMDQKDLEATRYSIFKP